MHTRHRLFVLTDIENEPDDTQSLVRLLLYSNEIDIEGIVAVTSTWLRFAIHPEGIHRVLKAYGKVRDNLLRVDSSYPTQESLGAVVGEGVVKYGMEGVGEGMDSTGSELLIKAVDRNKTDGRPLHVALWGGASVLAQALWKVRRDRSALELEKFVSKIFVYAISDQDDAGPWIRRHFPMLQFVVSVHGENVYMGASWIGFASNPLNGLPGADPTLVKGEWLKKHIQRGILGSEYPDVIYAMEGDTPSYLGLIPTGLTDPERPHFGGWSGRYTKIYDKESRHYHDACDGVISTVDGSRQISGAASLWRWRDAIQNDFAARMRWTLDEDIVERSPQVIVNGDSSQAFLAIKCKTGETTEVDASESHSPHRGKLSFHWYQYKEIDSVLPLPTEVPEFAMHGTENSSKLKVTLPEATAHHINDRVEHEHGRTYHIILEVTSEGRYPLTRYRRILLKTSS